MLNFLYNRTLFVFLKIIDRLKVSHTFYSFLVFKMPKDKASICCVRYPIVKPMWKFKYVICVTLLSFFTGISDQLGAKSRNNRSNHINITRCKFLLFSSLKFVMQVYSSRIFDKQFKVIYIIPVKIQFTSCVRSCISHSDNVIRPRHAPHAVQVYM